MFKRKRNLLFLITIVFMFVSVAGVVTGAALNDLRTVKTELYQEGSFNAPYHKASNSSLSQKVITQSAIKTLSSASTVEETIFSGLESMDESIDVSSFNIQSADISKIYSGVVNSNPQLFYVVSTLKYSQSVSGTVKILTPTYSVTKSNIGEYKEAFNKSLENALAAVPSGVSDAEKVLAANEYLALNTEYDNTLKKTSAYDALVDGAAVCHGYTLAFNLIMTRVGIENVYVSSKVMGHAWSMVKVDGSWYHVDVTWNDKTPDELGRVFHKYLLVSDNDIKNRAEAESHHGWDAEAPKAGSDKYKNFFWNNVTSAIIHHSGKWYFSVFKSAKASELKTFDFSNSKQETLKEVAASWNISEGNVKRSAYVAKHKDQVYYNTTNRIYRMSFDGKNNTSICNESLSGRDAIYEMTIKGEYLIYRIKNGPRATSCTQKSINLESGEIIEDADVPLASPKRSITLKILSPKSITAKTKSIKIKITKGSKVSLAAPKLKAKTKIKNVTAKSGTYTFKKLNLKKVKKNTVVKITAKKSGYITKILSFKLC